MRRPPENEDNRYQFNRVEDGYLRLDLKTGQVSLCSRRAVGWACQTVPDDRAAFDGEIARLQARERRAEEGHARPRPAAAGRGHAGAAGRRATATGDLKLPNNADLDRMMAGGREGVAAAGRDAGEPARQKT